MTARFEEMGYQPAGTTPADTAQFLRAEVDKWRNVIEKAGVKIEQ